MLSTPACPSGPHVLDGEISAGIAWSRSLHLSSLKGFLSVAHSIELGVYDRSIIPSVFLCPIDEKTENRLLYRSLRVECFDSPSRSHCESIHTDS